MQSKEQLKAEVRRALEVLRQARHVVALVGAGMSVESGVPPFRGPGGLWTRVGEPNMNGYQLFLADPRAWWGERLKPPEGPVADFQRALEHADPNPGHYALAEMERMGRLKYILTQNVDDLHRRAGSRNVAEVHGNRFRLRCIDCMARYDREAIAVDPRRLPPSCPECGGVVKSDGVMFGEPIPQDVLAVCQQQAWQADCMLVIGTSAVVYPAAGFAMTAAEHGATLIEVNTTETPLSPLCQVALRGHSGEVLPVVVDALKGAA